MHWIDYGALDDVKVIEPCKLCPAYSMLIKELLAGLFRV
jgi:hypothetical protein